MDHRLCSIPGGGSPHGGGRILSEPARKRVRWRALAVLALATAATLLWVRRSAASGQERSIASYVIGCVALLLLLAWLLWGAGLRRRGRLGVLGTVVCVCVVGAASVRIVGVTGDFRPVLAWRWSGEEIVDPVAEVVPSRTIRGAFPQFLGPRRDGSVVDPGLSRDWSAQPPVEVWRRGVGAGWSGFAVAGGVAVTQEQHGEREEVTAYDVGSGRLLWRHADRARYATTIAGVGPRATPTIVDGVAFTHGATGLVNALDLATGELLWQRHPARELGAPEPEWGRSASPLVVGGKVVLPVGGPGALLVALATADGGTVWTAADERVGYSSPVLLELAGHPQIVSFNAASVTGHDPASGALLWRQPFPSNQPNVAIPLALGGDRLLVSAGYGVGSKALQVEPGEGGRLGVRLLWESPRLKAKFTNPVRHGGAVFGLDDGRLVCLDPETGERLWRGGRYGHGQTLLAGDLLVVQAEGGEVALVAADPSGFRELARFRAFRGKTWNPPALVGRHLLLRTDSEAALFSLPLAFESS